MGVSARRTGARSTQEADADRSRVNRLDDRWIRRRRSVDLVVVIDELPDVSGRVDTAQKQTRLMIFGESKSRS